MTILIKYLRIGGRELHLHKNVHLYRELSTTAVLETSKERIVILGAGWGGFRLAKDLDKNQYDVTVISPRNHFP